MSTSPRTSGNRIERISNAADAGSALESKKRERAIAQGASRQGSTLTGEIDQVIMRAKSAPGEILTLAADIIAGLKREHAMLTRHHAR